MKKILICSWLAGELFTNKSAGGSEYRSYLLFNEINKFHRYNISFIVKGPKEENRKINGVNVNFCKNNLFSATSTFNNKIISQDVFAGFAINRIMPWFYALAKLNNKKTIYFLTCDADVGIGLENVPQYYKYLPKVIFLLTDTFIAQNKTQYDILKDKYKNKQIYLLKNPCKIKPVKYKDGQYILWVGRNDKTKGIDILKKVILKNPEKKFKIIGITENELSIKNSKNLEVLGRIDQKNINKYYFDCSFLINTSKIEGFPNIFLQSFSNKKPIISYRTNPDDFFEKSHGGFCANGDINQFQKYIDQFYKNKFEIKKKGINGYNYIKKEHNIKKISKELREILNKI
ncbi:MAG: glycosyltransferase [archaeon]|jgi:glycosyltransferase involved in cell wall biosynthesis